MHPEESIFDNAASGSNPFPLIGDAWLTLTREQAEWIFSGEFLPNDASDALETLSAATGVPSEHLQAELIRSLTVG